MKKAYKFIFESKSSFIDYCNMYIFRITIVSKCLVLYGTIKLFCFNFLSGLDKLHFHIRAFLNSIHLLINIIYFQKEDQPHHTPFCNKPNYVIPYLDSNVAREDLLLDDLGSHNVVKILEV